MNRNFRAGREWMEADLSFHAAIYEAANNPVLEGMLQRVNDLLVDSCLFFLQAEDGIRGLTVTGVQTCALPILVSTSGAVCFSVSERQSAVSCWRRTEERRVGKECRSRWSPHRRDTQASPS